jgi:hypothetical protein
MFTKVARKRTGVGPVLLAAGTAGLFAVAACSSSSGSSSAPSTTATAAAAAASTPSAVASGSGGVLPSSTAPSWAAALGPGVTVIPPGTPTPGHSSPGAAVSGVLRALTDKSTAEYCGYAEPSTQAQCNSELSQLSASEFPSAKSAAVGYIAVEGDKAVAGLTGTLCLSGQTECTTNTDPAEIFTTLHTFSALWQNAATASGSKYSLTPLVKVNGNWYISSTS